MGVLDNLYTDGVIITYEEGDRSIQRSKIRYSGSSADKTHITIDGERLDTISHRYYGTSKLWWLIADMNDIQDDLINPFVIPEGYELFIPSLDNIENT